MVANRWEYSGFHKRFQLFSGFFDEVGAVEDRRVAPVPGHHPHLTVAGGKVGKFLEDRKDGRPILDARRIDWLQKILLPPPGDLVVAGMGNVRVEARFHLGECVVVITKY